MPEGDTQGENLDNARHMHVARGAGNQPALVAGADPEEGE